MLFINTENLAAIMFESEYNSWHSYSWACVCMQDLIAYETYKAVTMYLHGTCVRYYNIHVMHLQLNLLKHCMQMLQVWRSGSEAGRLVDSKPTVRIASIAP